MLVAALLCARTAGRGVVRAGLLGVLLCACTRQDGGDPAAPRERTAPGTTPETAPETVPENARDEARALAAIEAGGTWLARGEMADAEREFERALEFDPLSATAHFCLGRLRVQRSTRVVDATETPFARRDLERLELGIASLARAVELAPTRAEYWLWLGQAYQQAEDLANARRCLEQAIALDPQEPDAYLHLGTVYLAQSENQRARATLERALALAPRNPNSAFQLGQVLEVLRDFPAARQAYERAIANNPTQPEFYRKLLAVLERLGDAPALAETERELATWVAYDERLERRQRAADANPRDPAALRRLGELYLESERWRAAADWCTRAVRIDPQDAQAHLCCARARRRLKQYAEAEQHLRQAESLAPGWLDPRLELVRLFAETNAEAELAQVLAQVESTARADGASLFELGVVCREVARGDDAARLFEQARALGVTEARAAETPETDGPPGDR